MDNPIGEKADSTEQRIFDAAHEVFTQKGMDGAKMQDIADRAGINKALLHYYYRSKEKLYEAVVKVILNKAMPVMRHILETDQPLHDKISSFIDQYVHIIRTNPFIPLFIISEINKHPDRFFEHVLPKDLPQPQAFFRQVEEAAAKGEIRPIDPRHLVANIISMCVFPFIGKPMMRLIMGMSGEEMNRFLDERKQVIKEFVFNAIRP
jgi:AcrR family transcriptional regulator